MRSLIGRKLVKRFSDWLASPKKEVDIFIDAGMREDDKLWLEEYKKLQAMDDEERDRFQGMKPIEAAYEYSHIMIEYKEMMAKVKDKIFEIFCEDCKIDWQDDCEVMYLNLSSCYSLMSRLQFRMIVIKQRIKVLTEMAKMEKE